MDDVTIEKAKARLEQARAARDKATARDQLCSRIERKVSAKQASLAKAREEENRCKELLWQATDALEQASVQVSQRLSELEGLQGDLANADDDEEFSCDGEDEELDSEFKGNVEVVRLHRQLLAAKTSTWASERPKDNGGGRSTRAIADDAHGPPVPTDNDLDVDGA